MSYLLKSRFYREELMRWALILILFCWALTASVIALTKQSKTIVIAVSDDTSYLVDSSNIARDKKELAGFLKHALTKLYTYDEKTFSVNLSSVSDLMSDDLWKEKKSDYRALSEKLISDPLSQESRIESIEEINPRLMRATLLVTIKHKIEVKQVRVRVDLEVKTRQRTESNTWMYEIASIKDAVI